MNATRPTHHRAFTIAELLVAIGAVVVLVGITATATQYVSCDALRVVSADNLRALGTAHAQYALDWNDRQYTLIRDDLGKYEGQCAAYEATGDCHPPIILGADANGIERGFFFGGDGQGGGCNNIVVAKPFNFSGGWRLRGAFELPNARPFHEYLNGRFFDPVFYAPKDRVVLDEVARHFDDPAEYVRVKLPAIFSASYVLSPAAMYDPAVFAPENHVEGGWRDPDSITQGYKSPTVSQALHPDRKTRMLEHHWLQGAPEDPCNPGLVPQGFGGCQPYHFNHALRSIPETLFFDGSVRGLSAMEAMLSDGRVDAQTDGFERLWNRDTPLGSFGYLNAYSFDTARTSYHVLTTRGIRGRDTTSGAGGE